jgi:hypothetical protein
MGPGILGGITTGDWLALLRDNRFAVEPPYWWRAAAITVASLGNSLAGCLEERAFGDAIAAAVVEPPLFVLGIWRSGTTHLQNLLAVDGRLATPNWYQVSYPHTFLTTEAIACRLAGFFVPRRRMQDNMAFGLALPAEEEMALCALTPLSFWLSLVFPRRADHYDRYLTLRGASDAEVAEWKAALVRFVKKLTLKHRKPLVLKSPPSTARIRLLLELFPDAKFVHIHRSPYAVFQSALHTNQKMLELFALQRPTLDAEDRTIRSYREIYDAYFEEVGLIRRERFHELCFEDLERDPIGQMRALYEALALPAFGEVEPAIVRYLATVSGYRKNEYPEIPPATRERIAREWNRSFEAWGYPEC